MNRPPGLPERLLASDATPFERRLLGAALKKQPSPEASARMAKVLGVTVAAVGTGTAATTVAADATLAKATVASGTASLWPWVSVGVLGLAIAGAVVGTRAVRPARDLQATAPAVITPPAMTKEPALLVAAPPPGPVAPTQPRRAVMSAGDLGDQISAIDSAQAAMSAGNGRRALEILRRYLDRYPAGSFRPEAIALEVEALMKVGREAEAQTLAERFVAEHRGSLLARRVADLAGLAGR
jgi:hypothetical protein